MTRLKSALTKKLIWIEGQGVVEVDSSVNRRVHRAKWPILSDALGVNPEHIGESVKKLAEVGVSAEYTEDGRAVLRDPRHRRDWARAAGVFDRNGGYGDPQRQDHPQS